MKTVLLTAALLLTIMQGTVRAEEPAPPLITIAAVGDVMMGSTHPDVKLPPRDGEGIFDAVRHLFAGSDIVFGNLEGPLIDGGKTTKCETLSYCFAFRTPVRYVRYLKEAGFTALGVANNHASDFGEEGRESTLRTLASAGLQAVGGPAVARFTVRGRRVAFAGFSYSTSSPYSFNILDIPEAQRVVRRLKSEHDIVIVSFHGGAEGSDAQHVPGRQEIYRGEDRGDVMRFSRSVIDAGADLVIGHGPHVLRALEVYRGKLIAYSLGNFLTYERFSLRGPNGISMVLRAALDPVTGDFIEGSLVPVRLVNEGIPEPDPERTAVSIVRTLTRKDISRQNMMIAADGTIRPSAAETAAY